MNNKRVILFFVIFAFLSATVVAQNKPQQKDKNKETRSKTEQNDTKSVKATENKEKEKSIANAKIDTLKGKLKNVRSELDSLINSGAALRLKLLKKNGHASYYHNRFNGRRTASGKRFDNNAYTAAHKKLPFGTKVRVTNEANGKSVIVEITDRGPFSKVREIDLTRRAFMDIATNKNSGVVLVTLEIIEPQ